MKKILTLLWLAITAFTFKATAQPGTTCNAEFSVQYLTNYTVKFNPVLITDSPLVRHFWSFGDGSTGSQLISPTHTYVLPGSYAVVHTVLRTNPNNVPVCTQVFTKIVVITQPCNLVANFSWSSTAFNPLTIAFQNLSVPLAATDSIRWIFGDGSSSLAVNPVHTYNVPGTYTVCLRVKKNNAGSTTPCVREICKTIVVTAPCNLVANFNWTVTQINPLRIEFHNLSVPLSNTDSIKWTFGNGATSTNVNPVHTYNAPGTYTVCLRVKKLTASGSAPCIKEICKTVVVTAPCNIVANFTWIATQTNPLRIEFNNTSTNTAATDSICWTFGDGTTSNQYSPLHTYATPGTYNVCLRIIRNYSNNTAPCIREICKTVVVQAACNLVANFISQPDPNHPLRIKFTNTSTPISTTDSVRWTFGDGTSVSGLQSDPNVANPTHNYLNAGNYTVCLRVKKNNNSTPASICVREKCNTVVIRPPCNFVVNFSTRLDSVNVKKVYFTNLTNAPSANAMAVWNFGDGISATSWNAVHEYAQPGQYRVCLKVYSATNTTCFREKCDTVIVPVPVPPCTQLSKYHFQNVPGDNQKYKFTPDYINTTFQYTWTFGDGTGSHDPVAIHRYAQPGVYVACLTVWRGPECASTTCKQITVLPQINCDTAHAWYTYQRNAAIPNKVKFFAHATLPIIDQVWKITGVGGTVATPTVILHENNPIFLFQDTGYFRVCLKATLQGGCVKEYCNYIRIEQVSNACQLQAFPNPTSTTVKVNVVLTQPEMINAYVYNSLNVLQLQQNQQGTTGNNLVTINVSNLAAGQYTIRLVCGNQVCYASFQKL